MRASSPGPRSRSTRAQRTTATAGPGPGRARRRGLALGVARGLVLAVLAVAPFAAGQAPPPVHEGLVWQWFTTYLDPSRKPPDGITERNVDAPATVPAGRVDLAYDLGACTETRTGSWTLPIEGPLARGDTLELALRFTIDEEGCRDGRTSGVAVDVGIRPAFLAAATEAGKPFAGYRFVDAFAAALPNAATSDSATGRPFDVPATVTLLVTRDPAAADELAEFRIATSVPGYGVIVAYVFRAVARP